LNGIRRIGKTLTFENGGLVAMVQERATLALVQLCENEKYRRRAFKIGLAELMLHQLQNGKTVMAMEGQWGVWFMLSVWLVVLC
jgi:hypothetical protein